MEVIDIETKDIQILLKNKINEWEDGFKNSKKNNEDIDKCINEILEICNDAEANSSILKKSLVFLKKNYDFFSHDDYKTYIETLTKIYKKENADPSVFEQYGECLTRIADNKKIKSHCINLLLEIFEDKRANRYILMEFIGFIKNCNKEKRISSAAFNDCLQAIRKVLPDIDKTLNSAEKQKYDEYIGEIRKFKEEINKSYKIVSDSDEESFFVLKQPVVSSNEFEKVPNSSNDNKHIKDILKNDTQNKQEHEAFRNLN